MNCKSIEIDGERYIKVDNRWLDSSYIVAPSYVTRKILLQEIKETNIEKLSFVQIKNIIDETRSAECYDICLDITEKLLRSALMLNDMDTVKYYISVKTSCLRNIGQPLKAIDFCKSMKYEYGEEILSVASLTSLAAAYCDLDEWDTARQTADCAYKKQGGGVGYENELSKVYKRINAANKR